ncbi:MAG: hypothetical protein DRH32_04945 [Deltaproteobacteria bacterium]|nr:MAG: hypothetical protein DRH32_04945 [Deltaproteobacteria bacterium]
MPPATLPSLYYTVFALFFSASVLILLKKRFIARIAMSAGTLAAGIVVMLLVITEHRLPLYGAFESAVYILFVVSMLDILSARSSDTAHCRDRISLFTCIIILIVLIMEINKPRQFNQDFFMYGNVWVNCFFNLRLTAAAFFIHASVLLNTAAWERPDKISKNRSTACDSITADEKYRRYRQKKVLYRARSFLLTGIVIYLASEWSGSIWCLNWLGDSWRWSKGFFKAAVIFLLVMTSVHLPP